jgi:DNA-binding transcriptional ArsR family regulator
MATLDTGGKVFARLSGCVVWFAPQTSLHKAMTTPFEHLALFDKLVHEPARLAILTALSACEKADFIFLHNITGLTKGNLSSHLGKLEQGGLVAIEKMFEGKQPITYVALTPEGRDVLKLYWKRFDKVRAGLRKLKPLRTE